MADPPLATPAGSPGSPGEVRCHQLTRAAARRGNPGPATAPPRNIASQSSQSLQNIFGFAQSLLSDFCSEESNCGSNNKSIILFSYCQWEKLSVSTAFCVEARKTRYVGEADRLERTAPPEFGRNWEFGPDLVNNVEF